MRIPTLPMLLLFYTIDYKILQNRERERERETHAPPPHTHRLHPRLLLQDLSPEIGDDTSTGLVLFNSSIALPS